MCLGEGTVQKSAGGRHEVKTGSTQDKQAAVKREGRGKRDDNKKAKRRKKKTSWAYSV